MLRDGNWRKRRIHEVKTEKNYCLWGKIDLEAIERDECIEKEVRGKFEWKT